MTRKDEQCRCTLLVIMIPGRLRKTVIDNYNDHKENDGFDDDDDYKDHDYDEHLQKEMVLGLIEQSTLISRSI
jgi:hypothetical protein